MEPDQERQHGPQQAETDNRGHEKKAFLPGSRRKRATTGRWSVRRSALVTERVTDAHAEPASALPSPGRGAIPAGVRAHLRDARRSFDSDDFDNVALRCGEALEGTCTALNAPRGHLIRRLESPAVTSVVDGETVRWAQCVRQLRNDAAHDDADEITRSEAAAALILTEAVVDRAFRLPVVCNDLKRRWEKTAQDRLFDDS